MIKKMLNVVKWIVPLAIVAVIGLGSFYTVEEQEQAVVTTFGKVTAVESVGLHFKAPLVQKVEKLPVNIIQEMTIGYGYDSSGEMYILEDESRMLTGDDNIIDIDFYFEWKISDPVAYLYHSNDAQGILKALTQSCARNIVGSKLVDDLMTTGKDAIQSEIEDKVRENLVQYDIGVDIVDLKIQDVDPPTDAVSVAFKNVENAKLERETIINNAKTYEEQTVPQAQSEADKILREAEANKAARIAQAEGEASRFNAMYAEYANNKDITRQRMYLEMVEELLPGMDVYINTTDGGTSTLIPVGTLTGAVAAVAN
ncbi:MAG: FtsH protease activity modulator HflK [Butyricicoccus sp.]|nr:FtsH protease activity modulator HflK [Butyricicoccus sp.]MBQ8585277.1 FtsH protease activity modulator HflK [Butyricicoccus sp.]